MMMKSYRSRFMVASPRLARDAPVTGRAAIPPCADRTMVLCFTEHRWSGSESHLFLSEVPSGSRRMPSRASFVARWSPRIGRKAARLYVLTGPTTTHRHLVGAGLADPLPDRPGLVQDLRLRGGRVGFACLGFAAICMHLMYRALIGALRVQGLLAQRPAVPLQGLRDLVPKPRPRPRHRPPSGRPASPTSPRPQRGPSRRCAPRPRRTARAVITAAIEFGRRQADVHNGETASAGEAGSAADGPEGGRR